LGFHSLIRTFNYVEGTSVQKFSNKFGISFTYSYLCSVKSKKRLIGMTLAELKSAVGAFGMPAFTGKQLAEWLYGKRVGSIDEMTNISKQNRQRLDEEFEVGLMAPIDCQRSKDGTIKYLFPVSGDSVTTSHQGLFV
jgi:23S rRNA (adenine2503-C2)-methyltransferase